MEKFESISKEHIEERPEVFSYKSFPAIIRFARRFDRLRVPVSTEETGLYEKKYGQPPAAISPEDIAKFQSISDLRSLVDDRVGEAIQKELIKVLQTIYTSEGNKLLWKEEEQQAFLRAAKDKIFDDIDTERNAMMTTALGLGLVAERSRVETTTRVLDVLPKEILRCFGMTEHQRDVLNQFLKVITKIDAEYMRHRVHIREKRPYAENLADLVRERRFVAKGFKDIGETINRIIREEEKPVFGSQEKDEAFLEYFDNLQGAYAPFKKDSSIPLSVAEQQERIGKAQDLFLKLHTNYPDFPLIVFPAFSHYESEAVFKEGGEAWRKIGFDPEVRLYWQTKELQEKRVIYDNIRDQFAEKIDESFSDLVDTADARNYRVILGEPIAASGINLFDATVGQEEKNIILMVDTKPDEIDLKNQKIFESYLENPEDIKLIREEAFWELSKRVMTLHEFGHGLYSEASPAADALGHHDDEIAELKSDVAMWSTAVNIFKKEAGDWFGEKTTRAVQLAMVKDALCGYRKFEPKGENSSYFLAAKGVLEILLEKGVLIEQDKKIRLVVQKLDDDLTPAFAQKFRQILQIYFQASRGIEDKLKAAQCDVQSIIEAKPSVILNKIKNKQ